MGSIIHYHEWDGGSGFDDRIYLIGYCKEEPIEVIKKLLYTHDIHHYLGLYMPFDRRCPCNVSGLDIDESNGPTGCVITLSVNDLKLSKAKTNLNKTRKSILDSLEACRRWHTYPTNKKLQTKYWSIIDSLIDSISDNPELLEVSI